MIKSQQGVPCRRQMTTIDDSTHHNPLPAAPAADWVSFSCGLAAGVSQAGLFNPYDRALYLSVKNRTRFLSWKNFQNPYQGFFQSIGGRALSGGLYFPLEQAFMRILPATVDSDGRGSSHFYNFWAGTAAGATNAMIVNPLSAVRYKTWGRKVSRGMLVEAHSMLQQGGSRPFLVNGLVATVLRDVTFGGCYTFLRLEAHALFGLPHDYQWLGNLLAAALATIVSGPFNLARNVQYSTKSSQLAPTTLEVWHTLLQETKELSNSLDKLRHVQSRLRIGWGTARVAVGMSFGHAVYDHLHSLYEEQKRLQERQ